MHNHWPIIASETSVASAPKHPCSSWNKKEKPKFPNYKIRCSIGNYLKYIKDCVIDKTKNGMFLIKKESPYSEGLDFMILSSLPPIYLEVNLNGKSYKFSTDDKLEDVLSKLQKEGVLTSSFFMPSDVIYNDSISQNISGIITALRWFTQADVKLKIKTNDWYDEITPETQIWKYSVVSRSDFDKKWEYWKKEDTQKMIEALLESKDPEDWKVLVIWFNYTKRRLDWKDSTWKDGWVNWQSFEDYHMHFTEVETWWKKIELTKQQEDDFHDRYISEALSEHNFNWWDTEFQTLEPLDNTKNDFSKQWISFKVKKDKFKTKEFWEEYDLVVKIIEDLNFWELKLEDFLYKKWYLPRKAKKIVEKLSYDDPRLNNILKNNKKLFESIVLWTLKREEEYVKEYKLKKFSRRYKWDDDEKSRVIPFPTFWHTTTLEKDHNWEITLKISPRIHSRAAVMEASWVLLNRKNATEEELNKINKTKEEVNNQVIDIMRKKTGCFEGH